MLAITKQTHDIILVFALVLFVVAGAIRAWARSLDGALVAFGLAFLAWSFLATIGT